MSVCMYTKNYEFIVILPLTVPHHQFHSRLSLPVFATFPPLTLRKWVLIICNIFTYF